MLGGDIITIFRIKISITCITLSIVLRSSSLSFQHIKRQYFHSILSIPKTCHWQLLGQQHSTSITQLKVLICCTQCSPWRVPDELYIKILFSIFLCSIRIAPNSALIQKAPCSQFMARAEEVNLKLANQSTLPRDKYLMFLE